MLLNPVIAPFSRKTYADLKLATKAALLAIFLISFVGRMAALDPASRISQYGHTAWRIQDGYFGSEPISITQTIDGYLWVGTENGVFRFDGVQFVPWTSLSGEQLPSNDVRALLGARDGSLWIATGSGLLRWVNQRSTRYLNGAATTSIMQNQKGQIWVTNYMVNDYSHPICRIVETDAHCYGYGGSERTRLYSPQGLTEDASENLWIGHDTALVRWRPGSFKAYRPPALQSHQGIGGVLALALAGDGSIWVGSGVAGSGGGLQRMVDGALKPFVAPKLNGETLKVITLFVDREGNLWVGTDNQGIYRIHGTDVDHFGSVDGLSADGVTQFFEDREGDLWVATSNAIDMLRDLPVTTKREGLSQADVHSVLAARDGTIWIGSDRLQALGRGGVSSEPRRGLPGNFVTSLLEDHADRLWVGMDDTLWIREKGKSGTFRQIRKQNGSPIGMVMGLTEDLERNIWVATHATPSTLIRIQDLKVREEFPAPPMPVARKLVPDPQNGIWLGLVNGNLARFRSGNAEIFTFANHPNARVKALFASPDGSILGATEFGVVGWKDGKQQVLTVRNGLLCNDVNGLITDDQRNLWLYASCGLIEIPKDEVQRWWEEPRSELRTRVFDALDGVQSGNAIFNSSSKTPDGRLWYANGNVLQTVDPAHISRNTVPPPVYVNAVIADRKSYPVDQPIHLPALSRDLQIDYTALSYVVPQKVLFRYILEGRDAKWQEADTRRQAFYTDLGPGHYRFHVIACNSDSVWNEIGASLDFSIAPAYYQTTWFRLGCVAAFLLSLWAAYVFRIRQLEARMEARVDERTRIARELHDTLLQSFQGAVFQFQAARRLFLRDADNVKQVMDGAIQAAEEGITEGRAAIHDLRPEPAAPRDLPELLKATGHELAATHQSKGNAPTFDVIVEGKQQALSPMLQDEVYRISREVIRNAFHHAAARHIEVEIHYDIDHLRVRIRDDGKGIEPRILKAGGQPGHWGIPGMRERAQRIGSQMDFWSEKNAGTEMQLTVPAAAAYKKRRNGHRFRLFHRAGGDEQHL
ncbi:MAG TPA: two-component regulator propeller domain-containing protein [Acidobacteriaceae bacterium]